jgi:hypothetical protein
MLLFGSHSFSFKSQEHARVHHCGLDSGEFAALLFCTIQVTDLNHDEQVILGMDVRLACIPNSFPAGDLFGQLHASRLTFNDDAAVSPPDVTHTGDQTIPFKQVGQIANPSTTAPTPSAPTTSAPTTSAPTCLTLCLECDATRASMTGAPTTSAPTTFTNKKHMNSMIKSM